MAKKIYSKKKKRYGWKFRFTSPLTGGRTEKTFFVNDRRLADQMCRRYLDDLEGQSAGVPSSEGWKTSYADLVSRFLSEAPISSDDRRERLRLVLERNDLGLTVAAELNDVGKLTSKSRQLCKRKDQDGGVPSA